MSNKKNLLRKGGYVADYSNVSTANDYIIYIPPSSNSSSEGAVLVSNTTIAATPGMTNGIKGGSKLLDLDFPKLANDFLYSMEGGCSLCNSGGGLKANNTSNKKLKGGFALEPFITALALLGARMLADKEVGLFNNKTKSNKYEADD
jgi:hypothetical protein